MFELDGGMVVALLIASLVSVGPVDALELDWLSPPGCPREHEIEALVSELVIDRSPELRVRASGTLHRVGEGAAELGLDLEWGDKYERFELRGSDCEELGRLAAQLIANVIDPFGYVRTQTLAQLPEPEPEQPDESAQLEPIPVTPERPLPPAPIDDPPEPPLSPEFGDLYIETDAPERNRSPRRLPLDGVLQAEGTGLVAAQLGVVAHPRINLGLELGRARVLVGGGAWFGGEFRSPTMPEIGGQVRGWAIELGVCWLPGVGRFEFPLCGRGGAGQIVAKGVNVSGATTARQPWVWLAAEAGTEWWLVRRFALTLGVAGGASLVRPAFEVQGSDAALELPIGYFRFSGGLAVRFVGRAPTRSPRRTSSTDPRVADSNVSP